MAERAPGGNGVREGDPHAAVNVAAGMQVALVHLEPALDLVVLDPDHLDPEVVRKAAPDAFAEPVGCDVGVGQATDLSSSTSAS